MIKWKKQDVIDAFQEAMTPKQEVKPRVDAQSVIQRLRQISRGREGGIRPPKAIR